MTHSLHIPVLDNLQASAARGQHDNVIHESFSIENQLQDLHLHLLNMRAKSYVACAQFAKALDTAARMQEMNEASPLGYLCEGYIYMEQGRYVAASHVYDNVLDIVDTSDPLYESITSSKEQTIQKSEKRRDFICDLPMEISARIIQKFFFYGDFDQQQEYVMVSWAWWNVSFHPIISSTTYYEKALVSMESMT